MGPLTHRFLGHLVLNVSSLEISTPFYCDVLGLKEVARNSRTQMVFLSFGLNDHDMVLRQATSEARAHDDAAIGLRHVAFCIGTQLDELKTFRAHLLAREVCIRRIHEHVAHTSIYFSDPDRIELEAYVQHPPETWRGERQALRFSRPVRLD